MKEPGAATAPSSSSSTMPTSTSTPAAKEEPSAKQLRWTLKGAGVDVAEASSDGDLLNLARSRGIDLSLAHLKKNYLDEENSPYLLQHKDNPVNWLAFKETAFQMAKKEDKPILISIGYATCHWCHVMARESFEDEDVAELLNSHFVPIKVDREELPDVDTIYMTAAQSMGVSGGWPLNVFVTPDLKPFFAGTYFPKRNFMALLTRLAQAWHSDRSELVSIGEQLHSHLSGAAKNIFGKGQLDPKENLLSSFYQHCVDTFDDIWGGFSNAPKFPPSGQLRMLMRVHRRTQDVFALQMVEHTLICMAKGGLFDHLGGGFSRYSTDRKWLIPHFEKMLYDNSQIVLAYIEAYQLTKNENYAAIARDTLDYILRIEENKELGGYYSAEDSDSEGTEGKFYLWKKSEIESLLTSEEAEKICALYGITEHGNFEPSKNHLNLINSKELDWSLKQSDPVIASATRKMFDYRESRPRPIHDDKQLTGWNGMMITAMTSAAFTLSDDKYLCSAVRAATFVRQHLYNKSNGTLYRRFRNGEARFQGTLDDYACLINGLIHLAQATCDSTWLNWAIELQATQDRLFVDIEGGGYYYTPSDLEIPLIVRTKDFMDGACPSANSVSAMNLLLLERLTYDESYGHRASKIFKAAGSVVAKAPQAFCYLLLAVDFLTDANQQLAIIYPPQRMSDVEPFIGVVRQHFLPNLVVAVSPPMSSTTGDAQSSEPTPMTVVAAPSESSSSPSAPSPSESSSSAGSSSASDTTKERVLGLVADKPLIGDKATAYLCQGKSCQPPTNDPDQLEAQLLAAIAPYQLH